MSEISAKLARPGAKEISDGASRTPPAVVAYTVKKRHIFLSAGIPDQPQRGDYVETADPIAIRDAVRALGGAALSRGFTLVFGGHPAISPLVVQVAESLNRIQQVIIYQSREFAKVIPKEATRIPNFRWTKKGTDREDSIKILRQEMISSHRFAAAVFIGGMDGVEAEYTRFRRTWKHVPTVPVGSTGGAALNLWRKRGSFRDASMRKRLGSNLRYQGLFEDLLEHLGRD